MRKNYDLFISHSSQDKELANELCNYFESNGLSCWVAPRDVRAGNDYSSEIVSGIEHSGVFFLLLSENANTSQHVINEVDRAFNKQKTIIPFRLGDFVLSKSLEYYLSKSHWIIAGSRPEKSYSQLLAEIQQSLGIEVAKKEDISTKVAIQEISQKNLKIAVNDEVIEILNSFQAFNDLLDRNGTYLFKFLDYCYNIKLFNDESFCLLTGQTRFNQLITKDLFLELKNNGRLMQQDYFDFLEMISLDKHWEVDAQKGEHRKDKIRQMVIATCFGGIIGKELQDLINIGKEPIEKKINKYAKKCLHIANHSLELITYAMMSRLWDGSQEKDINFREAEKDAIKMKFEAKKELTVNQKLNLFFTLLDVFNNPSNDIEFPIPDLAKYAKDESFRNDLIEYCNVFQTISIEKHDIIDCYNAEKALSGLIVRLSFLSFYKMASVKEIGYRKIKNFSPRYVHRYIPIGIVTKADAGSEKIDSAVDSTHSNAVLLYKGNDLKDSINLFPFVVDYNSLSSEKGSRICLYYSLSEDGNDLQYIFLDDKNILKLRKMRLLDKANNLNDFLVSEEKQKALNLDCVADRFIEARRCILDESIF